MDEQATDKRKVMTPARAEHMRKMREALAKKKEMEKNQPKKAAPKGKRTPPEPAPEEDIEEVDEESKSEEEIVEALPKRKITKTAPVKKPSV